MCVCVSYNKNNWGIRQSTLEDDIHPGHFSDSEHLFLRLTNPDVNLKGLHQVYIVIA